MSTTTPTASDFATEWAAWHDEHERARASEHGFLAITSIRWLTATPERFDDAPGTWSTGEGGPVVELADGETITVDGQSVTGTHRFGPLPERSSTNVVWQDGDESVVIEVARRGGSDVIRPRHPGNATRTEYPGTPTYEPSERFVVEAHFEPFDEPREVTVGSVVDGLQHVYSAPGVLTFDLDGPRSLLAFNGHGTACTSCSPTAPAVSRRTPPTGASTSRRRTPRGPPGSTSPARRTCRARTRRTRRARCPRPRTGSTWRSRRGSACPSEPVSLGAAHARLGTTSSMSYDDEDVVRCARGSLQPRGSDEVDVVRRPRCRSASALGVRVRRG